MQLRGVDQTPYQWWHGPSALGKQLCCPLAEKDQGAPYIVPTVSHTHTHTYMRDQVHPSSLKHVGTPLAHLAGDS